MNPCRSLALVILFCKCAAAQQLDTIIFGDAPSEAGHSLVASNTFTLTGALSQPARRCLSNPVSIYGGDLTFNMNVDPSRRNYFSLKLWGGEDTNTSMGRLYLYVPLNGTNYQVGFRHEADHIGLNATATHPPLPGKFFYSTILLPLWMTQGQSNLTVKLVSAGELYALGSGGPPSGTYQYYMKTNSRAIYRAYTHTDPILIPTGETQGTNPVSTVRTTPTETQVLGSAGTYTTGINNWIAGRLSTAVTNLICTDVELLARSYAITNLSNGYHNTNVANRVITAIDSFANAYYVSSNAVSSSAGGNEWWGGRFGALGNAVRLIYPAISNSLDVTVNYTNANTKTRRQAWGEILKASRDFGRFSRDTRYLANQTLIANANIYKANAGLLALGDANAFAETNAQRYLREAVGLEPWLGSDLPTGGSSYKYSTNYFQVTLKGLTREWGYVGGYGEMPYFAAEFYSYTSNTVFRDQATKMMNARALFRRPAFEISGTATNRAMERIGLLSWRGVRESDSYFATDLVYGDDVAWDQGMYVAAKTLDSNVVGYAKQMLDDGQYFNGLVSDSRFYSGLTFDSRYAMDVFGDWPTVKAVTNTATAKLPMTDNQPDFAWADEDSGIVAIKHGSDRLWLSTYWQCRAGVAVNGLGRFHYSTTNYDQYGTLEVTPQINFSGAFLTRSTTLVDSTSGTAYQPPDNPLQAYGGERMPIAAPPPLTKDPTPFNGKAQFWTTRYGNYLIGINPSDDTAYELKGFTSATNLITGTLTNAPLFVAPRSTVVLYLDTITNSCAPPLAPLSLKAVGDTTPSINFDWSASSGADSYTIKRADTLAGPYTELTNGVTDLTYADTNVVLGTAYYYIVTATNACGESDYPSMIAVTSPGLPAPWQDADIGSVGVPGNASYNVRAFTVRGSGSDIGGTADALHYAYLSLNTNSATIIARLATEQVSGLLDKVGLMMRESTNANAITCAVVLDTQTGAPRLVRRTSIAGSMAWQDGAVTSWPPKWLQLQRSGSAFIGSVSNDGITWAQVASNNFTMATSMLIGFAVCSRNNSLLNVSTFDNVTVAPGWANVPAPPTALDATAGDSQIGLKWTASAGATSYNVKRAFISGGSYTTIASNLTATSYTDTGLANGTAYFYVVSAMNPAGESANSDEDYAIPTAQPPNAPDGLSAVASDGNVALTWNSTLSAAGYNVKRATINGGPYSIISSNQSGTTDSDSSVTNGITYYYVVSALNGVGESPNSLQVAATPVVLPSVPFNLMAVAGNANVALSWSPATSATGYAVKRATVNGGPYTTIANVTSTSYLNTGLNNGTTYYYVVAATNAFGSSANTAQVNATPSTGNLPPPWLQQDIGAVSIAGGATYNNGTISLQASGADVGGTGDQFHFVYQPVSGNCTMTVHVASIQNTFTTPRGGIMFRETLNLDSRHASVVDARGGGAGIFVLNRANTAGNTVSNNFTGGGTSVPNWLRLVRLGNVFTAFRSSDGSNWTTLNSVTNAMATNNVYVGLALTAHNNSLSCASVFDSVTLTKATTGFPTNLVATAGNTQVALSWSAMTGATSYNAKRSLTNGGPYTTIASPTGNVYTNTGLDNGTTYYFVVSAANATGESADSAQVTATPLGPGATSWYNTNTVSAVWSTTGAWTNDYNLAGQTPLPGGSIDYAIVMQSGSVIKTNDLGTTAKGGLRLNQLSFIANNTIAGSNLVFMTSSANVPPQITRTTSSTTIINNDVTLANDTTYSGPGTGTVQIFGTISGPGKFTMNTSGGTLQVNGNNTYTGGTLVSNGIFRVSTTNLVGYSGIGAGPLTMSGGRFFIPSQDVVTTYSNAIVITTGAAAELKADRNCAYTGSLGGNGTLSIINGFSLTTTFSNDLSGFTGTFQLDAASGANSTHTLALKTGGDSNAAFVVCTAASKTNTTCYLQGDATVRLGSLSGGSASSNRLGVLRNAGTFEIGALNTSTTFSGVITTGVALVKVGYGTLTLSGLNPYTGATTVNAGKLQVDGSIGNGPVVVAGKLGGTGIVNGPTAVNGTLTGALTFNNNLIATGALDYTGNTTVNGNLTFGGVLNATLTPGNYTLFTYTGTFANNGVSMNLLPYYGGITNDVANKRVVLRVMTDAFTAWQLQKLGSTDCATCAGNADFDGDGLSNTNEFLAGTDPANPASAFRILSIAPVTNDIVVSWQTAGGRTNIVQAVDGDYSTNYFAVSGAIIVTGSGDAVTNYTDAGGATNAASRFYRIGLKP